MPENTKNGKKQEEGREEIIMPDLSQLWKEIYFKTEEAWANAVREFISTRTFVDYLDKLLEYNLSTEKLLRQSMDRYMETVPLPSKKDIARVAEMVISMEDKVDNMEFQLMKNIDTIANSLLQMLSFQEKLQQEMADLKKQIDSINQKIESMANPVEKTVSKTEKKEKKSRNSKKNESKEENA
ncbi:hypothetical protein [Thermosyntropha sp.]|uniref:hypothetical protein n=1 Tax=Thermosyntropha sp. TaxID=2740820 RepID=UPI0025FEDF3F|nr:hypothetical protein [Thermosyntropha sp.]MBO8157994.1 hypothetical protein [Thermosyntropha sp.]